MHYASLILHKQIVILMTLLGAIAIILYYPLVVLLPNLNTILYLSLSIFSPITLPLSLYPPAAS